MLIGAVNQSQPAEQGIAAQAATANSNTDTQAIVNGVVEDLVEISAESKQKARENKNEQMDVETLMEQMENARAQGEAMGDMLDEKIKCLRIAMNIMSGDKVPEADIRFLAEKDPELYARSLLMRKQKEDPQDCERITEDEEEECKKSGDSGKGAVKSCGTAAALATVEVAAAPAAPAAEGEAQ